MKRTAWKGTGRPEGRFADLDGEMAVNIQGFPEATLWSHVGCSLPKGV